MIFQWLKSLAGFVASLRAEPDRVCPVCASGLDVFGWGIDYYCPNCMWGTTQHKGYKRNAKASE